MRLHRLFLAVLLGLTWPTSLPVRPADSAQGPATGQARDWTAVGRLDVAGRAFCTGALIEPDLVLTAAHCLLDPGTDRPVRPSDLRFRAGLRAGQSPAERSAIAIAAHPDFDLNGPDNADRIAADVALVRLASPVPERIAPFSTAPRPRKGDDVSLVAYGGSHANSPDVQKACQVLARRRGMLMMNCRVEQGASGAPVFAIGPDGRTAIVSVVSSITDIGGRSVALGTDLQEPLALLRDLIAQAPIDPLGSRPAVRRLSTGRGHGAKFVRP